MSWLPDGPRRDARSSRPWRPRGASLSAERFSALSYIVVEEIIKHDASLVVTAWPTVDELGRLRFGRDRRVIGVDRLALERFLEQRQVIAPKVGPDKRQAARGRPLTVGDVFGARETGSGRRARDPARWLEPPVVDVSALAREAAQASFLAAVSTTLSPTRARRMLEREDTRSRRGQ